MYKRAFYGVLIALLSLSMNATPVVAVGEELEQSNDAQITEQLPVDGCSVSDSSSSNVESQEAPDASGANDEVNEPKAESANSQTSSDVEPSLFVNAHVANRGWLGLTKVDADNVNQYFGTVGCSLQLEALTIKLDSSLQDSYIQAQAHVAGIGWMDAVNTQQDIVGTTGRSKGIEAIKLTLKGSLASQYDLYYQVHSANFGWLGWAKNGDPAGSQGFARSLQAVRIALVKKGDTPSFSVGDSFRLSKATDVSVTAHVAKRGWLKAVSGNQVAGTTGQGLSMEALKVSVVNPPCTGTVELNGYANGAWQGYRTGACGTTGKSIAIQALKIRLTGELSQRYDVWYQVHIANSGWLDWTSNDAAAGSIGYGRAIQAVRVVLVQKGSGAPGKTASPFITPKVTYSSHMANVGWASGSSDSAMNPIMLGSVGKSRSLQAFTLSVADVPSTELSYGVHVSNIGSMQNVTSGQVAGTTGRGLPIESVHFSLSGQAAERFDVWYRVHVSNIGWLGWTCNGAEAGSQGISAPVEAIQVYLSPKGQVSSSDQTTSFISKPVAQYSVYVANNGWTQDSTNGTISGTTGKSLPIKGFRISLQNVSAGGISYSVHVSNKGWLNSVSDGLIAGSGDLSNNVEAIRMSLTGTASKYFDVWYRVHIDKIGWLGWTKNGANAGSVNRSLSVQAIQVVITRKGGNAPGSTNNSFVSIESYATSNAMQRRVVDTAKTTPSPGPGLCAQWVANVFNRCGFGDVHLDARDYYWRFCKSSDRNQLKVGMVIAVPSHAHTSAGSIWGHVCIFIGDNKVMDNVGHIRKMDLNNWLSYYSTNYTPKWGWYKNVPLA